METQEVFHFDESKPNFDDFSHENGETRWFARDFMQMLGYDDFSSFKRGAIQKAMVACNSLSIPIHETIISIDREINGRKVQDFKLSRFGCYLVAMNGDVRKPEVAKAQAYFAAMAESVRMYIEQAENVERIAIREEVSDREKSLFSTAKNAQIQNYPFFVNAGYRGLYNMNISDLRKYKGVPDKKSPLDYMGKVELAANLFRLTQTEEKIKNDEVKGQRNLEITAESVGKKVRKTMEELSGTRPEDLPVAHDIKQVKSELKKTNRKFKKIDKK